MSKAFFQQRHETIGVPARVGRDSQHRIVTSHLAFYRKPVLNPPHRRMKKEESAHNLLNQICPIVTTSQVFEFVRQNNAEISRWKFSQRPCGKDNRSPPKSDSRRNAQTL